ncbi:OpgC family protein [Roseivivax isoporae]|uniref:Membrane protein n=1 Tax=Roseivivax isoporae LMG 25204 TaxID=1449351 RepID=X7FAH1_9RHOB|nr:OpgC domain-containing protein [Roseivivax isoporae]ETX29805.1 membrane protein [Roseivivax isoporae LMG 25204]
MSLAETALTAPLRAESPSQLAARAATEARMRDPRLDFFRGIAMFIILVSHTPGNWLTAWIPARFGFSDATEIFVFCSGMASAIAFGAVFARRGLWMGTARVAFRCWQVYWAHIGLFFAVAATVAALDATGAFERIYVGELNLVPFFEDTAANLVGLMTLTYVPNYFDILPMYLVILAMMPVMVALYRLSPWAALAAVVGIWVAAQVDLLALSAEPWSDREWFFNPFGWQLVFFTGFAFMARWLPAPPRARWLVWVALAFVVLTTPVSSPRVLEVMKVVWPASAEWSMAFYADIREFREKTDFGILRYVHFLALAYLAWMAAGEGGHRLRPPEGDGAIARAWEALLAVIMKVGQQSLAVFIASMYLARILGLALDIAGRNHLTMLVVNLAGFCVLAAVAYGAGWFKSQPWRRTKG